jgi:hypothetical protein
MTQSSEMMSSHYLADMVRRSLYGGLAQQEPTDPTGVMNRLRNMSANDEEIIYPCQYDNENVS